MCSSFALGHSGRTDSNGGHNCSSTSVAKGLCSGYHYHNQPSTYEQRMLQYGAESAEGLRQGLSKSFDAIWNGINKRKLEGVLKEHPNAKATLRDPRFLEWATQEDVHYGLLIKAWNDDADSLDKLLTIYDLTILIEDNPEFKRWLVGLEGAERELIKADKNGDLSWVKKILKEWKSKNPANTQSQRTNSKSGYVICKTVANGETVQEVVWASTCPDGAVTSNSNKSAPVVDTEPEKDEDIDTLTSSQPVNAPQQSYAVRVADCILKDKEDYLSLDWYHENHLRLFTEKFYEIEKARDKLVFGTPTAKREKDLLKKIGHSKSNALRFLIHAQETGKMHHQAVLLNLLACNGQQ